jgi:hypothetical protein
MARIVITPRLVEQFFEVRPIVTLRFKYGARLPLAGEIASRIAD